MSLLGSQKLQKLKMVSEPNMGKVLSKISVRAEIYENDAVFTVQNNGSGLIVVNAGNNEITIAPNDVLNVSVEMESLHKEKRELQDLIDQMLELGE